MCLLYVNLFSGFIIYLFVSVVDICGVMCYQSNEYSSFSRVVWWCLQVLFQINFGQTVPSDIFSIDAEV